MGETFDSITGHSAKAPVVSQIRQQLSSYAPTLDKDSGDDSDQPRAQNKDKHVHPNLFTSMVAGAAAGIVVDISLFPLDTLKTRLQSKNGFIASGGFRHVYKGIGPVLLGSAPISALFFGTYNTVVNKLNPEDTRWVPLKHVAAASVAEIIGASIRVPLEIIKQRKQISMKGTTSLDIVRKTLITEGIPGMYRGFLSTISREVPFAAIQFPTWEYLKKVFRDENDDISAIMTAYCGALAGGIAAALTTPMDVIKTRIMLAEKEHIVQYERFLTYHIAVDILQDRGITGFFAGVVPRVLWITLGGFVYFGVYEKVKNICEENHFTVQEIDRNTALIKAEAQSQINSQTAPTYTEIKKAVEEKGNLRERMKKRIIEQFSPSLLDEQEEPISLHEVDIIDYDLEINIDPSSFKDFDILESD